MTGVPAFHHLESAYQLHFYLCFKTHYLRPMFEDRQVRMLLGSAAEDACMRHGYHLLDTQLSIDHVRVLLSLKPDQTVSKAVQILKGNLSRRLSLAFPDLLARYRTKSLWAEGYFARSTGKSDLEATRQYVEGQPAHHGYRGEWIEALEYSNPTFHSPAFVFDHCVAILNYHVVLVTKFRTTVFDEHIAPNLFDYIIAVGNKHGFAVEKMSLLPDHLHLILEARPDVSITECVSSLLNNTHYWMEKRYWGVLKETGCWDVWQPSFYAGTLGEYTTAQVREFLGGG